MFFKESDNFAESDIKDVDFTPSYGKNNITNNEEYDELMTGKVDFDILFIQLLIMKTIVNSYLQLACQ